MEKQSVLSSMDVRRAFLLQMKRLTQLFPFAREEEPLMSPREGKRTLPLFIQASLKERRRAPLFQSSFSIKMPIRVNMSRLKICCVPVTLTSLTWRNMAFLIIGVGAGLLPARRLVASLR